MAAPMSCIPGTRLEHASRVMEFRRIFIRYPPVVRLLPDPPRSWRERRGLPLPHRWEDATSTGKSHPVSTDRGRFTAPTPRPARRSLRDHGRSRAPIALAALGDPTVIGKHYDQLCTTPCSLWMPVGWHELRWPARTRSGFARSRSCPVSRPSPSSASAPARRSPAPR